jgi:hypothetical protein
MKNLTATICLTITLLLGSAGIAYPKADGLKMIPLTKIMSDDTSFANTSTYLLRCISLYKINAAWLKPMRNKKASEKGEIFSQNVDIMIEILVKLEGINFPNEAINFNYFTSQMEIMSNEYTDMMKKSKALTGNVYGDPIVLSDMRECKNYQNKISNFLLYLDR